MNYKFNLPYECKNKKHNQLFNIAYNYQDLDKYIFSKIKIKQSVLNTLNYLFYKMKTGIFVSIKQNKIKLFVPFNNENYVNEWNYLIKLSDKYKNYNNYVNKKAKTLNIRNKTYYEIENNKKKWSSMGCLLRHEKHHKFNMTYIYQLYDIIKETCLNKKIKDIDFFINKKDLPMLKKNLNEPFHHIWGNRKLISHKYNEYCPILTQSSSDKHFDQIIVNSDDWDLITQKYFLPNCKNNYIHKIKTIPWNSKISTAIFRGSSTGCGMNINNNQRLKVSQLSHDWNNDLLDAGITRYIKRSKIKDHETFNFINPNDFKFKLKKFMSIDEQVNYKYILNIEGNSAAYRLGELLRMKSVILDVESEYYVWFKKLMKPMIHYIPIKSDLSDLKQKILWCRKNDDKCKVIAQNSYKFYLKYINKKYVYSYMEKLLNNLETIKIK